MDNLLNCIKNKYNTLESKYFDCLQIVSSSDLKIKILEKEKKILENQILDLKRINEIYYQNCKVETRG